MPHVPTLAASGDLTECELSGTARVFCAGCRGSQDTPRLDDELGRSFVAKYEGTCGLCGEQFAIGDRIAQIVTADDIEYACPECIRRLADR